MHRPITWLLTAVVMGAFAAFFSVDLVGASRVTADSLGGRLCVDGAKPGCIEVSRATVVARRTSPRRFHFAARELTLRDAAGRHTEDMAPVPAFDRMSPGEMVDERRVDGRLLAVTSSDGSVLQAEMSPVDQLVFDGLLFPFLLLGVMVGLGATVASRRVAGWWEPVDLTQPQHPTSWGLGRLVIAAALLAYVVVAMTALFLFNFWYVPFGTGTAIGGAVALSLLALLAGRWRANTALRRS